MTGRTHGSIVHRRLPASSSARRRHQPNLGGGVAAGRWYITADDALGELHFLQWAAGQRQQVGLLDGWM